MNSKGFTLLEILVSITIIALLSVFAVQVISTTVRVNTKTEIMKDIKQNGDYVMDRITRLAQGSKDINCGGNIITFTSVDDQDTVITEGLDSVSDPDVCRLRINGSYLTSDNVTTANPASGCNSGIFTCNPTNPKSLDIDLTLMQASQDPNLPKSERAQMTFTSNVVLRNESN